MQDETGWAEAWMWIAMNVSGGGNGENGFFSDVLSCKEP